MTCRVRFGYAHVVNNQYDEWLMYAIGGSAGPTIFSEGNYFMASNDTAAKQEREEIKLQQSKEYEVFQNILLIDHRLQVIVTRSLITGYQEGNQRKLE